MNTSKTAQEHQRNFDTSARPVTLTFTQVSTIISALGYYRLRLPNELRSEADEASEAMVAGRRQWFEHPKP